MSSLYELIKGKRRGREEEEENKKARRNLAGGCQRCLVSISHSNSTCVRPSIIDDDAASGFNFEGGVLKIDFALPNTVDRAEPKTQDALQGYVQGKQEKQGKQDYVQVDKAVIVEKIALLGIEYTSFSITSSLLALVRLFLLLVGSFALFLLLFKFVFFGFVAVRVLCRIELFNCKGRLIGQALDSPTTIRRPNSLDRRSLPTLNAYLHTLKPPGFKPFSTQALEAR